MSYQPIELSDEPKENIAGETPQKEVEQIPENVKPASEMSAGSNLSLRYLPVYVDNETGQMYAAGQAQSETPSDEKKKSFADICIGCWNWCAPFCKKAWNWTAKYSTAAWKWIAKWSAICWNKVCEWCVISRHFIVKQCKKMNKREETNHYEIQIIEEPIVHKLEESERENH